MLHGNPTWSFYFRNLVLSLRDRFRVIVPDHIGCGLSDKPQKWDYTLENHITNAQKLIAHLGLQKINLVVHDWGGMIGFGTAVRQPENFKSIVAMNTCAFRLPEVNSFSLRIASCRIPVFGKVAIRAFNAFSRGAVHFASTTDAMTEHEKKGLMAPYNNFKNRIATHKFVLDIPLKPSDHSWETLLHIESNLHLLLQHPLQIIWGMKDFCFDRHFLREWKRFFPQAPVHQIREAGHYVLEDARQEVCGVVNDFLRSGVTRAKS
jgi:haloalkane dehalogenase